jgi:glycosyltransferase involved in cell wall biosynthesis
MHVLVVAVSRATSPTGVCRHAANLCRVLNAHADVRVTLLVGRWQEHYFRESLGLVSDGSTVIPIDVPNNSLCRNLFVLFGVPSLVRQIRPDVVHFSFPAPQMTHWVCGVKTVVSLHDLYAVEAPEAFGKRYAWANRLATLWGLCAADWIATVSQTTQARLEAVYPRLAVKSLVVPNMVLPAKDEQYSRFDDGRSYLLCVAQHRAHKRLDVLMEAFAALLRRGTVEDDTQLMIVGEDGPETKCLHALEQAFSLKGSVIWLSGLSDAELLRLYRNASLLVAPSRIEGFGLPVAEALAAGCRVACSRIAAHEEIARQGATYFEADADAEMIADAVEECLAGEPPRPCAVVTGSAEAAALYMGLYASLLPGRLASAAAYGLQGGAHGRVPR